MNPRDRSNPNIRHVFSSERHSFRGLSLPTLTGSVGQSSLRYGSTFRFCCCYLRGLTTEALCQSSYHAQRHVVSQRFICAMNFTDFCHKSTITGQYRSSGQINGGPNRRSPSSMVGSGPVAGGSDGPKWTDEIGWELCVCRSQHSSVSP